MRLVRLAVLHAQWGVAPRQLAVSASTGNGEATRRLDVIRRWLMEKEPTIFVGVDWASTEHQVCMIGPSGPVQRAFAHDAGGLGAMVDWLCAQTANPSDIVVAIEVPHGPVVEALMERGNRSSRAHRPGAKCLDVCSFPAFTSTSITSRAPDIE